MVYMYDQQQTSHVFSSWRLNQQMWLAFTFQQVISISGLILIDTTSDKQINLWGETYSDSLARTRTCRRHGAAIFKGPGRAEPVHAVPAAVAAAAAGQGRILPGGIEQSQESHESTRRCSKYVLSFLVTS